jgi:hypothetical protein
MHSASSAKSIIMMAFFLIKPISRMTLMMAITRHVTNLSNVGGLQHREYDDGGARLVYHSQHDVNRNDGGV